MLITFQNGYQGVLKLTQWLFLAYLDNEVPESKENIVEILNKNLVIQHLKLVINLIIQIATMVTAINNQKRLPKCLEIGLGTVTVLVVIACNEISLFWK